MGTLFLSFAGKLVAQSIIAKTLVIGHLTAHIGPFKIFKLFTFLQLGDSPRILGVSP